MANAIVTFKIMPESPDVDLSAVEEGIKKLIVEWAGEGEIKADIEPIAFGLKALNVIFVMDEAKGATDELEEKINNLDGVNSVELTDVRRAIG